MDFRTPEQLHQAKWAEKYLSVAKGTQYTGGSDSPFPLHEYFRNKLLGKQVKMLELNAGATLVDTFVSDTMTDMTINVGTPDEKMDGAEQEIWDWFNEIDYLALLEEAIRNYYAAGYGLQQPIFYDGVITMANVSPGTWYPDLPVFSWQPIEAGKVITPFYEIENTKKQWYAFVETHEPGGVDYRLLQLETKDALEGKEVGLGHIARFKGIAKSIDTQLDYLDIFQVDRQKDSGTLLGQSLLAKVWDMLQEISETKTQIRHERIKHLKAKMYVPRGSLQRAENVNPDPSTVSSKGQLNSKQIQKAEGSYFDMNQEIFPIPEGSTTVPGYITRDLQAIKLGAEHIQTTLGEIAATVGAPKSIFNIDEVADAHVDTEKRKHRRYVRQIVTGQARAAYLAKRAAETYWRWSHNGDDPPEITITLKDPFEMTREEVVNLMREMNATADFTSRKEAVRQIWTDKTPDEQDTLLQEIDEEQPSVPPTSQLSKPPVVQL